MGNQVRVSPPGCKHTIPFITTITIMSIRTDTAIQVGPVMSPFYRTPAPEDKA